MSIRTYVNDAWYNQKALKVYNGSAWSSARQGWIYNGSSWVLYYPEFPQNSIGPSFSMAAGQSGKLGCIYEVSPGTWNSNDAYIPTSYSYQWTRNGSDIPGATGSQYQTTASDVDKVIGARVTATNNRGSTPFTITTGATILPVLSSVSSFDGTITPTAPGSVTVNVSNLTYSGSWTAGSSATSYDGYTTNGSVTINSGSQTFTSGSGTAGSVSVFIRSINTNYIHSASWSAASGASSYDIYINGGYTTNTTSTSYSYNPGNTNTNTITVYPRSAGGNQGYGASGSGVACSTKTSGYTGGSGTLVQPAPVAGGVSWSASTVTQGSTITAYVYGFTNSPTSYDFRIVRGTQNVIFTETTVASNTTGANLSYTIPSGDAGYYYKAFADASNGGGTSSRVSSSEIGPVPYITPSLGTPSPVFERTASVIRWGWDNVSSSGDINGNVVYEWEVRASASSGGTLIASGTTGYNSSYDFLVRSGGLDLYWNYRVTSSADLPYTASARYGRMRAKCTGKNGTTYYGSWCAFL
jgi:hypothetical protein